MKRSLLVPCAFLALLFAACTTKSSAPAESSLVGASVAAPAGMTLTKSTLAGGGTADLPGGTGWERSDGPPLEVSNEAEKITVMVQYQAEVPAEARDEYVTAFIGVNTKDAPKYQVTGKTNGALPGGQAARVDGTFDNGTAFATRDYLVFAKGGVGSVMVRGPSASTDKVHALADAVASSYRVP